MSESLRDLVVSLSLNTDNFTRNIKSVNKQIQEAESYFKLASAGVKDFDTSAAGLSAKLETLERKLSLQKDAVTQYERALVAASGKLNECYQRQEDYARRLADAKDKQEDLRFEVETATVQYEHYRDTLGETDSATIAAKQNMEAAKQEYADATAEVEKLAGQNDALKRSTQNAADAVSTAQTQLNKAETAVRETEAAVRDTNAQLRTAQSEWTAAGKTLEEFSKKCDTVGKDLEKAGRKLTATVTAPVVALGTTAVNAAIEFESSFASVRKTVDASEAEFAQLAETSKRMSTEVAASTGTINEVMAAGGQLGIATEHLEEFSRVMIDLGNSCEDLNAEDAAASIAKFANVMGTDQSMFSNIGSTIVDLGNNFATTERPIMEMAQRLAGAGRQVGLTEAQVLGFAAALSSVGIEAQMGGSAFSKALINMEVACATGGEKLDDFATVCGMTADQFKVLFEADPAAAFQSFIVGLANIDEAGESSIAVLNDIGIKEVRLRDTLLRSVNATELFANAQTRANAAWKQNTALSTEANKRYATTASRLTNLKNKATLFAQQLGDDLSPTIQKVMEAVDGFIDKLMGMDSAQREQLIKWAAIAAAVGPVLLVFGKLTKTVGSVSGVIGKFCTAIGKAGVGFSGFMKVLGSSPAVWMAVAAAVIAGTAALINYVSGAKAAREALKGMEETAKRWKDTAAETFYNQSEGLSFFGMSDSDFRCETGSAQEWLTGVIGIWSDGKKETDEIIREWTDSFKSLTASTRTELQEMKDTAEQAGYTDVSSQLQKDIDTLNAMDAEIEKLLKRRKNGKLTEKDKIRLQELIDAREAIEVKYYLSAADTDGFDTIRDKMEAEIARAQARGLADAPVSVYENAMVACAEGMAAVNRQIDEQYDKEHAVIQLIEDEDKRKAAQEALDARYREDRLNAAREYAETMASVVTPVWEQENIRQAAADVTELTRVLREYSALDPEGKKGMLGQLNELTASMDEASLVEYIGLLTQIQSLMDSGMTEDEVRDMFPDIDFSTALDQLAAIQQYLNENKWDTNLDSLQTMFGEAVPEEILTLTTDLDMTGAQARWDEFAANPGAITTDAVIAGIWQGEDAQRQQILVDAVIEKYTEKPEGADRSALSSEGLVAYVSAYAEATTGVDVSALNPQNITAIVAGYQELASGTDVSALKPSEIVAYVSSYLEKQGADMTGLTPEVLTATVLAYEEASGGALTTALTPDDITATVVRYLEAEGADVSGLTPGQIEAVVTSFAEAAGCDRSQLLTSFTAYVTEYRNAEGVSFPTIQAKVGISGYDTIAYRKFVAQNPVEVNGVVRLGEIYEDPSDILQDSDVKYYDRNGIEIPVETVPQELLTADRVAVLGSDGTLHVLITPEITGSKEAVEEMRAVYAETDQLGLTALGKVAVRSAGIYDTTLNGYVTAARERIATAQSELGKWWNFILGGDKGILDTLDRSMQSDFNAENIAELSTYVSEVVAAIKNGEEVGEEDVQNLQNVLGLIQELDAAGVGENVTQGVAEGMTAAGWDSSAETVASDLETALNSAFVIHSPSQRMKPIGENAAAGIAAGAAEYDFSATGSSVAAALETAVSTGLTLRSVGVNAIAGLAAGIRAGTFSVTSAMRTAARSAVNAAKNALVIKSPSHVFRDEVGVMTMKGFGEGILEESKNQARIIRNASRYLTEEAKESAIAYGRTDNRKTYNQQSSVNLSGNTFYIRDDKDVQALAIEIASLTKRRQIGRGLRMA
jgi:TP901 family phage tail tape measure protein